MATKKTKTTKATQKTDSSAMVTRIKATDKKVAKSTTATNELVESTPKTKAKKRFKKPALKSAVKPIKATGGYFKGAWIELRQVRWPTRRATWGLTGAVLAYTAFFVVLVLLLDAGFKYVFQLILGK